MNCQSCSRPCSDSEALILNRRRFHKTCFVCSNCGSDFKFCRYFFFKTFIYCEIDFCLLHDPILPKKFSPEQNPPFLDFPLSTKHVRKKVKTGFTKCREIKVIVEPITFTDWNNRWVVLSEPYESFLVYDTPKDHKPLYYIPLHDAIIRTTENFEDHFCFKIIHPTHGETRIGVPNKQQMFEWMRATQYVIDKTKSNLNDEFDILQFHNNFSPNQPSSDNYGYQLHTSPRSNNNNFSSPKSSFSWNSEDSPNYRQIPSSLPTTTTTTTTTSPRASNSTSSLTISSSSMDQISVVSSQNYETPQVSDELFIHQEHENDPERIFTWKEFQEIVYDRFYSVSESVFDSLRFILFTMSQNSSHSVLNSVYSYQLVHFSQLFGPIEYTFHQLVDIVTVYQGVNTSAIVEKKLIQSGPGSFFFWEKESTTQLILSHMSDDNLLKHDVVQFELESRKFSLNSFPDKKFSTLMAMLVEWNKIYRKPITSSFSIFEREYKAEREIEKLRRREELKRHEELVKARIAALGDPSLDCDHFHLDADGKWTLDGYEIDGRFSEYSRFLSTPPLSNNNNQILNSSNHSYKKSNDTKTTTTTTSTSTTSTTTTPLNSSTTSPPTTTPTTTITTSPTTTSTNSTITTALSQPNHLYTPSTPSIPSTRTVRGSEIESATKTRSEEIILKKVSPRTQSPPRKTSFNDSVESTSSSSESFEKLSRSVEGGQEEPKELFGFLSFRNQSSDSPRLSLSRGKDSKKKAE